MASGAKISKTARASIGKDKDTIEAGKPCPQCKTPMVATRVMTRLLFEIKPTDATTYVLGAVALFGAAAIAAMLPTLRATRVSPATSMRGE